jgi:hypothetical protein
MSGRASKIIDVFEETLSGGNTVSTTVKVITLHENATPPITLPRTQKVQTLESACVKIIITILYSDTAYSIKACGSFIQHGKLYEDTFTSVIKCGENGYVLYGTNAFGEFSIFLCRTGLIDEWHMSKSYTKRSLPATRYMSTRAYYKAKEKPEDLIIEGGPSTRPRKRPRTFTGGVKGHTEWVRPEGSSP